MSKLKNLAGQPFGKLLVLERVKSTNKNAKWLCVCACGNKCEVQSCHLTSGHTTSCGCSRKRMLTKHGKSNTGIYRTWRDIKDRCHNPQNARYKDYGGRGITVCPQWVDGENGFLTFYNDVSKLPHFDEKGYSINRIDNDGDYAPGNVEWSSRKEQANNTRRNRILAYKGERKTMAQWAKEYKMPYEKLKSRITKLHWSIEKALETP